MNDSESSANAIALYIHVPFCKRKCKYCSFVSFSGREGLIPRYLEILTLEINRRIGYSAIETVYFGGGTPSLLSSEGLCQVLDVIDARYPLKQVQEITLEANPGTVSLPYLSRIRALGINRLSLGVQSLKDAELSLLGRIHTAVEAREAIGLSRAVGFDNLNVDLIYGIPGQMLSDWQTTLGEVIELAPEHISLYALSLEEGTPLFAEIGNGILPSPDQDLSADQYELAEDLLGAAGYRHYEISNWARPGFECRHNLFYWKCQPYLGIGVAAHSCIQNHRTSNTADLDQYLAAVSAGASAMTMDEEISPALQLSEAAILGLRLIDGLALPEFEASYHVNLLDKYKLQIEELIKSGLLILDRGYLRLTRKGRLMGNEVFHRFLP